jgi:RHS repeat-associated protein
VQTNTLSAFGQLVATTGIGKPSGGFCAAVGYQFDSPVLRYYVRRRTYDQTLGRWTSSDPLQFMAMHPYAYHSPTETCDPSGFIPWPIPPKKAPALPSETRTIVIDIKSFVPDWKGRLSNDPDKVVKQSQVLKSRLFFKLSVYDIDTEEQICKTRACVFCRYLLNDWNAKIDFVHESDNPPLLVAGRTKNWWNADGRVETRKVRMGSDSLIEISEENGSVGCECSTTQCSRAFVIIAIARTDNFSLQFPLENLIDWAKNHIPPVGAIVAGADLVGAISGDPNYIHAPRLAVDLKSTLGVAVVPFRVCGRMPFIRQDPTGTVVEGNAVVEQMFLNNFRAVYLPATISADMTNDKIPRGSISRLQED